MLFQAGQDCGTRFFFLFFRHVNMAFDYRFLILFLSSASATMKFRLGCGSFRKPPAERMHGFPAATPQVGQATEDCCSRVGLIFILSLRCTAVVAPKDGAKCEVYDFLTDIGRFSRNAVTIALFIFKPPL